MNQGKTNGAVRTPFILETCHEQQMLIRCAQGGQFLVGVGSSRRVQLMSADCEFLGAAKISLRGPPSIKFHLQRRQELFLWTDKIRLSAVPFCIRKVHLAALGTFI